jgi:hypothetical protein
MIPWWPAGSPAGAWTGWSTETGRIWRDFGLKPHVKYSVKLSTDPLFIEKVVDVERIHEASTARSRGGTSTLTVKA